MDFFPTILESLGLPTMPNEHLDGISIVPLFKDNGKLPERNFYWHYPHYDETTPYSSILSGDWKLIKYLDDNSLELYNLASDPMESLNLIDSYPKKREEMVNLLDRELNSVDAQPAILNPNFDPSKFSGGIREYRRVKGRTYDPG
jgi:arylsulfatase A-like enzyme